MPGPFRLFLILVLLSATPLSAATKRTPRSKSPAKAAVIRDPAPASKKEPAKEPAPEEKSAAKAPSATLEPAELSEFAAQPARIQQLITSALALTKLNLSYQYGSADPASGGMDCSGAIYHLLHEQGFDDVPRDSAGQYVWVRKAGSFRAVVGKAAGTFELNELLPGDLLFWSGTYEVTRDFPITHVMLYLGTEKRRKKRVMFGASDGRSYDGVQRWGVSVFDFEMPRRADAEHPEKAKVDFVGYGRIPGLRPAPEAASVAKTAPAKDAEPEEEARPKKSSRSTKPAASARKRP